MTEAPPQPALPPSASREPTRAAPAVAPGVQLLGEYAGSGFKEPPTLARRADGQVIQLPPLLHEVLSRADGQHDEGQIAAAVSEAVHRRLTADDVRFLLDEKLTPMGLIATADGEGPPPATANALLALRLRTAVLPERATAAVAALFKPLFAPVVVLAVLAGITSFDVWLFAFHGIAQPLRQTIVHPTLMLLMLAIIIGSAAFHETGHAAGCAYGGARPGKMGCGLYLAWPAFYTDITDSYRLDRRGRLRADLGGIYFNTVSILLLGLGYALTGFQPLLLGAAVIHLEIAHQLVPVVRLDGYYIVSDLTGVPDLFGRIGPILSSVLPWRPTDPRVTVLKRWVRVVVTGWVLVLLPVLGGELLLILMNLPRVFGTGYTTARQLASAVGKQASHGQLLGVTTNVLELLFLVIPLVGIVLILLRSGRALVGAGARLTAERPLLRAGAIVAGAAAVGLLAYAWIPPSHYQPIGPHDRGTLTQTSAVARQLVSDPLHPTSDHPPAAPAPSASATPAPVATSSGSGPSAATQPPATATPSTASAPSAAASPSPTGSASSSSPSPSPTPTTSTSAATASPS